LSRLRGGVGTTGARLLRVWASWGWLAPASDASREGGGVLVYVALPAVVYGHVIS
jgi:hypothetical protein